MNIFVSHKSPIKSARALDDKRVVKLILESAQMICMYQHYVEDLGIPTDLIYKPIQLQLLPVQWTLESRANVKWLITHFRVLCEQYTIRYNRVHLCEQKFGDIFPEIVAPPPKSFANVAANRGKGFDFTHISNVHVAYRKYLNARWRTDKRAVTWTNTSPPKWYKP